eukprot:13884933-Alexandrium_andersonii.AAC.1
MDQLKKLDRQGNGGPLSEYKECDTDSERRKFALRLRLDPEGTWCRVQESSGIKNSNESSVAKGWLAIWEIAKLEGLAYSPKDPEAME